MMLEGEVGHEYFCLLSGGADVVVEQVNAALAGHTENQVVAVPCPGTVNTMQPGRGFGEIALSSRSGKRVVSVVANGGDGPADDEERQVKVGEQLRDCTSETRFGCSVAVLSRSHYEAAMGVDEGVKELQDRVSFLGSQVNTHLKLEIPSSAALFSP